MQHVKSTQEWFEIWSVLITCQEVGKKRCVAEKVLHTTLALACSLNSYMHPHLHEQIRMSSKNKCLNATNSIRIHRQRVKIHRLHSIDRLLTIACGDIVFGAILAAVCKEMQSNHVPDLKRKTVWDVTTHTGVQSMRIQLTQISRWWTLKSRQRASHSSDSYFLCSASVTHSWVTARLPPATLPLLCNYDLCLP